MQPFFLFTLLLLAISTSLYAQVGVGTTTPKAFFNVADSKDVLFGKEMSGNGSKLMWISSKAAFRAGSINGTQWDLAQIGPYSFAAGYNVTASGHGSTALGTNVSTAGTLGSFILGDVANTLYSNLANNQMIMRFAGGYTLYSNSPESQELGIAAVLAPGSNSWQLLSDSTRKENFRLADGASFLQKISTMRLGSWNYKGQDVKQYRHYGPMAQDFFAAFGHDALGSIGEDKSINQADFDGVNLIAIQALIKKVEKLETENKELKADNHILRSESATMKDQTAFLKSDLEQIKKQLASLPKQ